MTGFGRNREPAAVHTLADDYSAMLPRKRRAAGVLLRDDAGRVLLVERSRRCWRGVFAPP